MSKISQKRSAHCVLCSDDHSEMTKTSIPWPQYMTKKLSSDFLNKTVHFNHSRMNTKVHGITTAHYKNKEVAHREFFLETLTELSSTFPNNQLSESSEPEIMKDILTEIGISGEEVILETVTEKMNIGILLNSTRISYMKSQPVPNSQFLRPIVFIVNNTGKKLMKVNETVLENLLNKTLGKTIQEINLEYIDLHKLSEKKLPIEENTTKDLMLYPTTDRISVLREFLAEVDTRNINCTKSDFDAGGPCLCDIDSYLKTLKNKLQKNLNGQYECQDFVSIQGGIVINNNSKSLRIKKRSLFYLDTDPSRNFIETNLDNIFGEDYSLNQTESEIIALLGTSIKIPCINKANLLLDENEVTYFWEFTSCRTENREPLAGGNKVFPIFSLKVKDAGNYTCTKSLGNRQTERYNHQLEIINFPIYTIKTVVYYALNDSCSLSDGDVLYSYLPKILNTLICGCNSKVCSVNVGRPLCFSNENDSYLNVTISTTMNSIAEILPSNCDLNCKLKTYANLVSITYKNSEIVQNVPITSTLEPNLIFLSNTSNVLNLSQSPKIIITCDGGFGVEKDKQRICVLCPEQTYSGDDEAFCKVCPAGQYQLTPGSKICLPCSSPIDDVKCLRMFYSDSKLFKVYVGMCFGLVIVLTLIIIYWKNTRSIEESQEFLYAVSQKQRPSRRKSRDLEKGVLTPLLKNYNANDRTNNLPKVPIPDF